MAPAEDEEERDGEDVEKSGSDGGAGGGDSDDVSPRRRTLVLKRSATSLNPKQALGRVSRSDGPRGDEHVEGHRVERPKDPDACQLVMRGIKQSRFCTSLEDEHLETLVDSMEYYSFDAGDTIVKQGDAAYYCFVVHEGALQVIVNGKITNTMERGDAFGTIALIHDCPRTATVVATEAAGLWGFRGEVFRRVCKEHSHKRYDENRSFLDRVSFFDGLNARQKARIGELALFNEVFEAGARVVSAGEVPTAMYIVRSGELSVFVGGSIDPSGRLHGGARTAKLGPGDVFGEQALQALRNLRHCTTVVADSKCELVCIGIPQLKEVLGEDVAGCLERAFLLYTLRRLPVISQLSLAQLQRIVDAMELRNFQAREVVEADELRLLIVTDGSICALKQDKPVTLHRGTWREDSDCSLHELLEADANGLPRMTGTPSIKGLSSLQDLRGGPEGARLALLRKDALLQALRGLGLSDLSVGSEEGANDYMRKVLLARKVPIFRFLSEEQVDNLVEKLVLEKYTWGTNVFQQGDVGSAFFVVAYGELQVQLDGALVRTLAKGACFGERALLFDEPRSATVVVASRSAELWSISRESFQQVVTGSMREELMKRVQLQDTSISLKSLRHVRLIGAGSFGSVRLVAHRSTGVRYALKRVHKVRGDVPPELDQECALLAEMDHPFAICMVKTFETDKSVYILMELVTGGQILDRYCRNTSVLNRKQAQFYIASVVLVLEFLHERSIVYRDLKPENIMLDAQGYLKLVDFGIAKKLGEACAKTWTIIGTPLYMAPEVIRGRGYSTEVDIWALGVVLYELVCGQLPFGDGCEDEHGILCAILDDELQIPTRYADVAGRKLIQALLCKQPKQRLGVGMNGWEDVKENKFFKASVAGNLFSKIAGREMEAPFVPHGEVYTDEATLEETVSLSDADQLADDDDEDDPGLKFKQTPSVRVRKEEKAMKLLATAELKRAPAWGLAIKPPPQARNTKLCPRRPQGVAFEPCEVDAAPAEAPAPEPAGEREGPKGGRKPSRLREEVAAARAAAQEEPLWCMLPSVTSWHIASPRQRPDLAA